MTFHCSNKTEILKEKHEKRRKVIRKINDRLKKIWAYLKAISEEKGQSQEERLEKNLMLKKVKIKYMII